MQAPREKTSSLSSSRPTLQLARHICTHASHGHASLPLLSAASITGRKHAPIRFFSPHRVLLLLAALPPSLPSFLLCVLHKTYLGCCCDETRGGSLLPCDGQEVGKRRETMCMHASGSKEDRGKREEGLPTTHHERVAAAVASRPSTSLPPIPSRKRG